jgi:hypothetical protein
MDGRDARSAPLDPRDAAAQGLGSAPVAQVAATRIELEEAPAFRRRERGFETWGWRVLLGLLVATLLGAFGSGVLSWGHATSAGGLVRVDYERIEHRDGDSTLTVDVARAGGQEPVRMDLTGPWLQRVHLVDVTPAPAEQIATAAGLRLNLEVAGAGPVRVVVRFQAHDVGLARGAVTVAGESADFAQYVLP